MITISYAITVCTELKEVQKLLSTLESSIRDQDEIVVLWDDSELVSSMEDVMANYQSKGVKVYRDKFNRDFGGWKNKLTDLCEKDFVFQLDADELPPTRLVEILPEILELNKSTEVFLVPRTNTVEGLTQSHIEKWGWSVDQKGRINYPDYQWRIYKRCPEIRWVNKVHEKLEGFQTITSLPPEEIFSIIHHKNIVKQEKQNNLYQQLLH